ncbi:MAG: type 1 glutamine amidotransferase [Aestuariivirga sp.]
MRKAIVLQHMDHDHPGRFLDFFAEDGIVPRQIRLFDREEIPSLAGYDFMFVLGGAQDTWQEDQHPWLKAEKQAIREWVWERAKPYFGVCLGHQLLCTALGGEVALADESEVGVFDVEVAEDGKEHELFRGLPQRMKVMQWHLAEVKRAPQEAKVLAASARTQVQCVAIDSHAVGTQFHCEFSAQTMAGWSSLPGYIENLEKHLGPRAYEQLIAEAMPLMPQMANATRQLYNNLMKASGFKR